MKSQNLEYIIAKKVESIGGRAYYVGGCVRDEILGIKSNDTDIEVHGVESKKLLKLLKEIGEPLTYGKQFGIYSLKGHNIDIALPRTEKNTGKGHKDFDIFVDPNIGIKKAAKRRDFTINSIYKDIITGELIDNYGGIDDIKNKTIRHIDSKSFIEDPLRVLRGCRYAATLGFDIAPETIKLCKKINIKSLSKERVEEELKKVLLAGNKPSMFFYYLEKANKRDDWFKNVNTKYIDRTRKIINKVNNKYAFMLTCLSIDTDFDISKITNNKKILKYVINLKNNYNKINKNNYDYYKSFYSVIDVNDYVQLKTVVGEDVKILKRKHKEYKNKITKAFITGEELTKIGYTPNKNFNKIIKFGREEAFKEQNKKAILKTIKTKFSK